MTETPAFIRIGCTIRSPQTGALGKTGYRHQMAKIYDSEAKARRYCGRGKEPAEVFVAAPSAAE